MDAQSSSKKAIVTFAIIGFALLSIPITTILVNQPQLLNPYANSKETGVLIDKPVIEVTLSKAKADNGRILARGFLLSSIKAEGWELKSLEESQGVGFFETAGTMKPGERAPIQAYSNASKRNGKYIGTYQVRYLSAGEWYDGPTVNYIINLTD